MTSLAFPNDPNVGQTYMAPGGKVWRWGGEGWICLVDSGAQVYYNADPPEDIAKYPVWFNTDTGDLMVVYQDVDSTQWIKIGTTGGGGGSGGSGGGATYLGDLNDVDTTGVGVDDVISWNGTTWVPSTPAGAGSIDNATDVDTSTTAPNLNEYLGWDNTNWIPMSIPTLSTDDLSDVDTSTSAPSTGDLLRYDGANFIPYNGNSYIKADGTVALTSNWDTGSSGITTGSFTVNNSMYVDKIGDAAHGYIFLSRDAGKVGYVAYRTGTSLRWTVGVSSNAESGSDQGSNFTISSYNDGGVNTGSALSITRSNNRVDFFGDVFMDQDLNVARDVNVTLDLAVTGSITQNGVALVDTSHLTGHAPSNADNTAANETQLEIQDETIQLSANAKKINFAGAGVVATEPVADEILVTIDGGGGGSALEVEDEGVSLSTAVTKINFAGVGVTATEPVADEILVTIAGGAGVSDIDDLGDVDTSTVAPTVDDILEWDGTNWVPAANAGGSGGASAFTGLTDTPPNYTNQKGKTPVVNQDETGLEFGTQGNIVYQDEVSFRSQVDAVGTTLSASGSTIIVHDQVAWNHGGGTYDDTTGYYYVPVAGRYRVNARMFLGSGVASSTYYMQVVGSVYGGAGRFSEYQSGTTFVPVAGSCVIDCVEGEYIRVIGYNGSGTDEALYSGGSSDEHNYIEIDLLTPNITVAPHGVDVGFSVNLGNVDQVITDTAPATVEVEWTEARYEKNCSYDFTNNRFVAPSAGIYQFGATLQLLNVAGTNFTLEIITSKGTFTGHRVNVDNYTSFLGHANIYLDAGDTAYVSCYAATDSSYSIRGFPNWSYFFGTKVSGTSTGIEYDSYDVAFGVGITTDQPQSTLDTWIPLEFDNVVMDNGGNFDDTNYKFIAPVDGIYQFNALIRIENFDINNTSDFLQTRLTIENNGTITNATVVYRLDPITGEKYQSVPTSATYKLQAGATVGVDVYQHVDTTVDYQTTSNFSGHLVQATTKAEASCHAYLDTNQTLTSNGAWEKININATEFDYGSIFDSGNNRILIPEDGRYQVNFGVGFYQLNGTDTHWSSSVFRNGESALSGTSAANKTTQVLNNVSTGSGILDCAKGDYLELMSYQDEGTSETARGLKYNTFISVYRLVTSQDTPKITSDLSDVSSNMPVTNDVLMYDGTEYVPTDVLTENVEHSFRSNIADTSIAANSSQTKIDLSNASFDIGSNLDFTNDRFIVPVDGRYQFNATARLSDLGTGKYFQLILYKNGAIRVWGSYNGGDAASEQTFIESQLQAVDSATAGDYFELYALNTDTSARSITGSRSTFSGHLISPNNNITLAPRGIDHHFSVNNAGTTQTGITNATWVPVEWGTVLREKNVAFDLTGNAFIAPSSGLYNLSTVVSATSVPQTANIDMYLCFSINDVQQKRLDWLISNGSGTVYRLNGSSDLELNAGDEVRVEFYHSDATNAIGIIASANNNWFAGHKVSGSSTGVEYDSYDVAWHVKLTTPTTLSPASTWYPCVDDGTRLDSGGNYDSTNSVYIIPEDGIYQLNYHMRVDGLGTTGSYFESALFKNGVRMNPYQLDKKDGDHMNDVYATFGTSYVEELKAGDQIDVRVNSQSDTVFTIYGWFSGHIVKADSKAECSFKVHRNSVDQTGIPISTTTGVDFTNAEWDKGNNFNLTSNQFVAPEKGRYIFDGGAGTSSVITTDKAFYCALYKNASVVSYSEYDKNAITSSMYRNVSAILDLEKDDVVDLRVWHDDVTTEDISGNPAVTYLSGYRLVTSQDLVESTNDLADVYDVEPLSGDVLVHDGTKYAPTQILFSDEVSFNAVLASPQTLTTSVWTQLQTSTEEYDKGNNYNIDTYEFVSPIDGVYAFNASVGSADNLPADTELRIRISVNATVKATSQRTQYGTAETYVKVDVSLNIELSAGDVVTVEVRQVSGGNMDALAASSYTQFSGYLISPSVVLTPHGVDHSFDSRVGTEQAITSASTWTKVLYDTNVRQKNVLYDETNSQFICPSSGLYNFKANVYLGGTLTTGINTMSLYKNGSIYKYAGQYILDMTGQTTNYMMDIDVDIELQVGDIIDVRVYFPNTTVTVKAGEATSWFTGKKVSGSSTGVEYDDYDIAFRARLSATQTGVTDDTVKVEFDSVDSTSLEYDRGGNFDTTNNQFIAPVSGVYSFQASVNPTTLTDQTRLIVYVYADTRIVASGENSVSAATSSNTVASCAGSMYLEAGDTVHVSQTLLNGTTSTTIQNGATTYFSGQLIRATTKAECSFNAVLSANQTLTVTGSTPLELDTTLFNYGNGFNTTLNRFVAPEDGRYSFNFSGTSSTITSSTSDFMVYIRKNGTTSVAHGSRFGTHAGTYTVSSGSVIVELEKDDYIELLAFQDESISETIAGDNWRTFLSGYRVVSSQDVARKTSDLTDVNAQEPAIGEALVWNGTEYVPSTVAAEAGSGITSLISTFLFMGS